MARLPSVPRRRQARRALDSKFEEMRRVRASFEAPRTGWVRAIREALGMPARDLAQRMGVAESSVVRLEGREAAGSVQLDSLARAADALDCDLVYALIPRGRLDASVRQQARLKAEQSMAAIVHSMDLEDQPVPADERAALLEEQALEWEGRDGLWTER